MNKLFREKLWKTGKNSSHVQKNATGAKNL
jgi:hypothetical protein